MMRNPGEKELPTKQEAIASDEKASTSSRLWSGLKNPRIVRVSRAFGGKDRHSKVSTVRGLRDRRVRLSVPTAIQLYDLQDRLGLNQPSKVVDWLLTASQHEIDKLPPLQLPPGNFIQFPQSLAIPTETPPPPPPPPPSVQNFGFMNENGPHPISSSSTTKATYWNSDVSPQRTKQREEDPKEPGAEKGNNMIRGNEVHFLSNAMQYTSYYHREASNAYLSQFGIHSSQAEAPPMSNPSSWSLAPESQIVLCPTGVVPSMFPPYMAIPTDFDLKQSNNFQMTSSASPNQLPSNSTRSTSLHSKGAMRPFH